MDIATREVFWNIPWTFRVVFYAVAFFATALFFAGLWGRFSVWLKGRDNTDDIVYGKGLFNLAKMSFTKFFSAECFFAKRVFEKSTLRGFALLVTIWSFLALFIGTLLVAVDYDLGLHFLKGRIYLVYSFALDVAGAMLGICLVFYLVRRYVIKPERIVSFMDDATVLSLMLLIVVTGFSTEGFRLAYFHPEAMDWSPVGYMFSKLFESVIGGNTSSYLIAHRIAWISHAGSAFTFIAYIPFSKQFHMFSAQIVTAAAEARKERLRGIVHDA